MKQLPAPALDQLEATARQNHFVVQHRARVSSCSSNPPGPKVKSQLPRSPILVPSARSRGVGMHRCDAFHATGALFQRYIGRHVADGHTMTRLGNHVEYAAIEFGGARGVRGHGGGSIEGCGSKLAGTRRHECRPPLDAGPTLDAGLHVAAMGPAHLVERSRYLPAGGDFHRLHHLGEQVVFGMGMRALAP